MTKDIVIKAIRKKDYKKAIDFAIVGMHFDWYLDNGLLLRMYGRYFWYSELNRATQIIAAYVKGRFAGVLLAAIKGEKPKLQSFLQRAYVRLIDTLQNVFFKGGPDVYERTCKEQLSRFLKSHEPDGEILFLACDPTKQNRGVGTALLRALEKRSNPRLLYLFTDDGCTYQFYEHRGFLRNEETRIVLEMPRGSVPLHCFLYSRVM